MCSKTHTSRWKNKISQSKLCRTQFLRCKSSRSRNYYLSIHNCCNKDRLQSCGKYPRHKDHSNIIHILIDSTLLVQLNSEYYLHLFERSSIQVEKDIDCRRYTVGLMSNRLRFALIVRCRKQKPKSL